MVMYNDPTDVEVDPPDNHVIELELEITRLKGELAEVRASYEGAARINAVLNEASQETRRRIVELESSAEELRRLEEFFANNLPKMMEKESNPVSATINLLTLLKDVAPSIVGLIKQTLQIIMDTLQSSGVRWNGKEWVFDDYSDTNDPDDRDYEQEPQT